MNKVGILLELRKGGGFQVDNNQSLCCEIFFFFPMSPFRKIECLMGQIMCELVHCVCHIAFILFFRHIKLFCRAFTFFILYWN